MLQFADEVPPEATAYLGYRIAADALCDPRGRLVRVTPTRRTAMHELPDGSRIFCKMRHGRRGDALREWCALAQLPALGIPVPRPLFFAERGSQTCVGMAGVPGRPMDARLVEGAGYQAGLRGMPGILRRLHRAGWVYRDMYWNHVFSCADDLYLVDVERAFRPRFRFERWVVKDLAGLLASVPVDAPLTRSECLRFLRRSLDARADWKRIARRVVAKAEQIRAHVTKYP